MSDKERLEMIKGIQKRIKECQEKGRNVSNLHSDYVDWLIEQTEKAEKYREALEFYADENSYRKIGFAELYSPAERDFGQKARQALEGEE